MRSTFAQRHSSDFERLALELVQGCFGITPTKVLRTRNSKDGGFDAVLVHTLGQIGAARLDHETLMEAKLRTGRETVGLRAFAATMIVAFNGRTQSLVVVANRAFSPQALQEARDFQWKSRLQVILVNQKTVSAWVRSRLDTLSERYPRELLDDLILPDPALELYEETDIPQEDPERVEPPARIAFGVRADGTMADPRIVLEAVSHEPRPSIAVAGHERRQVAAELIEVLAGEAGCAVLTGEQGTGKSHVISAVVAGVAAARRCVGIIDLAYTRTARQLFLATAANLLGVDLSQLARELTPDAARTLFATVGGSPVSEAATDAVLRVLSEEGTPKSRLSDVNQLHLLEYLALLAASGRRSGRVMVFHNIDRAFSEVVEFLHALTPVLTSANVSVVLEVTPEPRSQIESSSSPSRPTGNGEWRGHVALFERNASFGRFSLPALDEEVAIDILLEELPGIGRERARFITGHLGTRPLLLHHAALWLRQRRVVQQRAPGANVVEQPELLFEGLRPEAAIAVLDRHIDIWRHEITWPFADAITAATLLRGRVDRTTATALGTNDQPDAFLDALVGTGLFLPDRRLEGVRVSHSLLLERMIALEEGRVTGYGFRPFERKRVAELLLSDLDHISPDPTVRELDRSQLLFACGALREAWDCACRSGQLLVGQHQLALAAMAHALAGQIAEALREEGNGSAPEWRIDSVVALLEVENERYRLGLRQNQTLLRELSDASLDIIRDDVRRYELALRSGYLRWRAAFTREDFDEAERIARSLDALLLDRPDVDSELAGRAIAALGITLKAVGQRTASVRVFDDGVHRFPGSSYCRIERWSNLAALALPEDPACALELYRRILADEGLKDCRLLSRVHTEVDLGMALFLLGRIGEAQVQVIHACHSADANGIPAQGARSRNILGCIRWDSDDVDNAVIHFDRAVLDAERAFMDRFLWRFRVNLALAATEAGLPTVALSNARSAEERIVAPRQGRLAALALDSAHVRSRWYAALLALAACYEHCGSPPDRLRVERTLAVLPGFHAHVIALLAGEWPPDVFDGTTHRRGNRIMITG